MADRFHVNQPLEPGLVVLQGPEAHHLVTVCRIRPGDTVCLFNGDGYEYASRVVEVTRRAVTIEVRSCELRDRERPGRLHLAVALPKGDRAQVMVEKLTELGVHQLTVVATERSVVHPREAKVEKLHRYVIEASKQCGRNRLMEIAGPMKLSEFVQQQGLPKLRLIAHPNGPSTWPANLETVAVLIGPEGGFTENEVRQAESAGWSLLGLGPRILRIETAAIAVAARATL